METKDPASIPLPTKGSQTPSKPASGQMLTRSASSGLAKVQQMSAGVFPGSPDTLRRFVDATERSANSVELSAAAQQSMASSMDRIAVAYEKSMVSFLSFYSLVGLASISEPTWYLRNGRVPPGSPPASTSPSPMPKLTYFLPLKTIDAS